MGRRAAHTCHVSDGITDQKPEVTVLEKSKIHDMEGFSAELNSLHLPSNLKDK